MLFRGGCPIVEMDNDYCLSQLNPAVNCSSVTTLEDTSGYLGPLTPSTSNKCPILKVKSESDAINYASSSTLVDSSGLLHHETSSTSKESFVHEVKLEDHHSRMAKLEYEDLPIKEEMSYKSQHSCDHCTYGSKSIFFMLNHVRRHRLPSQLFSCAASNVEPYLCKNCNTDFDSIIHLQNHIKEQHSMKEEMEDCYSLKSYICETCSFASSSALESLKHVKTGCLEMNILPKTNVMKTVKKEGKWVNCEKCTSKAANKFLLHRHILCKHTDDETNGFFVFISL